jgi:hypothetical protein
MQQVTQCSGQGEKLYRLAGRLIVLLALLVFSSRGALAQLSTADIVGTVTDATGAVVSNATVTVLNLDTHDQRVAVSNDSGDYQFTLLPVGHYSVTVKRTGFKTTTTNLAVEAGDRARADIHLATGGATEVVVVEATTPLLQAENATVSSTVTEQSVQDLPLNGRNFVQLVQIVPGANEGPGNGLTSGGRPDDRRTTNGFSVNGQDDTLNNFIVDGIDDNERIIGTIGVKPAVEDIEEITIQTNSYAPEAGRTAGGVVNLITKSGTNKFHGTAYEFFRNDKFDGRDWFATTGAKPELRQNQYGGSLGGPIIRNKTFFFGDYEGIRLVKGTTYTSTVPTLAEYNNINSLSGGTPALQVALGNGLTSGVGGSGTSYTAANIDPVALNLLKLYPAPNVGGASSNTYSISPNKTQFGSTIDARVDQTFSQNDHFFARFDYNKVTGVIPAFIPAGANPNAPAALKSIAGGGSYWSYTGPAKDTAQDWALGYTHIFSQNLVADLRAAWVRINNFSQPNNYASNADVTVGFTANSDTTMSSALTPTDINDFNSLGDGAYVPLQDIDNTFQYSGTVSYTIRSHNLKAGAGLIRRQARNLQSAFQFGHYSGFGLTTDSSPDQVLASTLLGAFTGSSFNIDLDTPDYRTWEPSFFVQDNWKVNPKLSVTYGVRYDVFTPFTEAHNRISNFNYNQAFAATTPAGAQAALQVANVGGVSSQAGIQTTHSDFAPRIGFSYSLRPTTVLRGGYGLSYFPGNYTSNADLKNAPFTSVYSANCQSTRAHNMEVNAAPAGSYTPACDNTNPATSLTTYPGPNTLDEFFFTPGPQTITSASLSFTAEDPKDKPSLVQQYNLQIEQQFGPNVLTVGYVGNMAQHLPELLGDVNDPTPAHVAAGGYNTPRPLNAVLPNVGQVQWLTSEGISNYNGLQASFQRRFAKGLAFDANYTWGHAISDVVGFSEEGHQGWGDADPQHIRQIEYGNAENDLRHRFALSVNYELPFKNIQGPAKYALGGWQINSIASWQTGKPFSIFNNSYSFHGLSYGNWATPQYNGGPDRPDQIGNPFQAGSFSANPGCVGPTQVKTIAHWINPCAYVPQPVDHALVAGAPALGLIGNTARNSVYGPHFRDIDFSLFKDFPIFKTLKLQFRAEAFNIINVPNFYLNNNIHSSEGGLSNSAGNKFGQIVSTDPNYVPRQLQFALKLKF